MKTSFFVASLILCFLFNLLLFAQSNDGLRLFSEDRDQKAFLIGDISPVVLPKDRTEINFQNNLTSFWLASQEFGEEGGSIGFINRSRFSRLEHFLRIAHGFAKSGRWDLGAEIRFAHQRIDQEARSSPFRVFEGETPTGKTFRGLTYLGLRSRVMPVKSLPDLNLQASLLFPIGSDDQVKQRLNADRIRAGLLAAFSHQLNYHTSLFFQTEWQTFFPSPINDRWLHVWSAGGYFVLSLWDRIFSVYPGLVYASSYEKGPGSNLRFSNQQLLGSLGVQYQPAPLFGLSANAFLPFILDSRSQSVEWVRESYLSLTLGVRFLF